MKRIHVSNTPIQGDNKMTRKQGEYLRYLFQSRAISNPFDSYRDMKGRLSRNQARRTIDAIIHGEEIDWIIPSEI